MFEHVGVPAYARYFAACHRLLEEGRRHAAAHDRPNGPPYPPIRGSTRYIFPGGHLPSCPRSCRPSNARGSSSPMWKSCALHYAIRSRSGASASWQSARKPSGSTTSGSAGCGNAYLAMSESAFRFQDAVVFQIQLARRNDTVPITRDYIAEREAAERLARLSDGSTRPLNPSGYSLPIMRTSECDILIVPGHENSGPDHWQTRWERQLSTARRVEQDELGRAAARCLGEPDRRGGRNGRSARRAGRPQPRRHRRGARGTPLHGRPGARRLSGRAAGRGAPGPHPRHRARFRARFRAIPCLFPPS